MIRKVMAARPKNMNGNNMKSSQFMFFVLASGPSSFPSRRRLLPKQISNDQVSFQVE